MGSLSRIDGGLGKREAYQKIKTRLGLSSKVMIFKDFFELFYLKTGDSYLQKINDSQMDKFFLDHDIKNLNKSIFNVMQTDNTRGKTMYKTEIFDLKSKFKQEFEQKIAST